MTMAPERSFKFRIKVSAASFLVALPLIVSPYRAQSDEPAPLAKASAPSAKDVSLKKEEPKLATPESNTPASSSAPQSSAATVPSVATPNPSAPATSTQPSVAAAGSAAQPSNGMEN